MKCLLLILALMIPQMVMARIGETLEQCFERYGEDKEEKYGPSAPVGVKTYSFTKNGLVIEVSFWHGKAFQVAYLFFKCEQKLTVATFKKLQKANGGEREWGKLWEVSDRAKSAITVDKSMWGRYTLDSDGNLAYVTFSDKAAMDEVGKLLNELRAKEEEEKASKATDGL